MLLVKGSRLFSALIVLTICRNISLAENFITELEDELFVKHDNHTDRVTIYTEANFWGIPWSLTVANCTDVPRLLYKKASSINTHDNCMILYGRQSCQGSHVRVAPGTDGHSRLSAIDFDNTLASLEPCDSDQESDNSTVDKHRENVVEHNRVRRNSSILNILMGTGSGGGSASQSPSKISDIGNDSQDQDGDGGSDSEQQPEDDGAIDTPESLQNLNLKSVLHKFLNNNDNENTNGGNGWNVGRFRRTPENKVGIVAENNEQDQTLNDQQTSTPHPSVPIQNVIY